MRERERERDYFCILLYIYYRPVCTIFFTI